jgi:hypothetical protein
MSRLRTILDRSDRRDFSIRIIGWLLFLCVGLPAVDRPARADDGIEFFERKIRPLLVKHCYKCHSAAATEIKGGLRLDSRRAIRKGGESGPAVVPRNINESLLIDALRHETFEMPPDKKLPDAVIADFERWIKLGAPDPRDKPPTAREAAELSWQTTLAERRTWWSLQPVGAPQAPRVKNSHWSDRVIDRFILARLEEAGLTPADRADARTLIRRLSLILVGLPPSPHEVEGFLAEYAAQPQAAYDDLVDRLLDSPHFGERWARHWMDVVRFTETHGNEWNYEVHHAWRYRDYLIRALNQDVPYDQFVREHIAGDLLPQPRWNQQQQFNESVIGTAFYRFGEVNHDDCIGLRKIGFDIVDNQIDTLAKAFQATTVACSRCHDHKIDAVSTRDYYALLGILRSSRLVAHTIDSPAVNAQPMRQLGELKVKIRWEIAGLWLNDAANIGRYLLAAETARHNRAPAKQAAGLDAQRLKKWVAALKVKQPPFEHPLSPWLSLIEMVADTDSADGDKSGFAAAWKKLADRYRDEHRARTKFNDEHFVAFADFRKGGFGQWSTSGHGLRGGTVNSGSFCVSQAGDAVVNAILPAGCFTHTLSQKLNGTLRSPVLRKGKQHISFQVMGEHTSALRLVSNNCQLNYKNYRALTSEKLGWVTFSLPEELDGIRVYAELMTKFDNPKFPDQLGTLGGDKQNDRIPWEQAAADPRSYFGITRVVRHDGSETPKPPLDHLTGLFENQPAAVPQTLAAAAERYSQVIQRAIRAWGKNRATDAEARWLDWLVKNDLLDNSQRQTPQLAQLLAEYRAVEQHKLTLPRIVPGVADFDAGFDQPVLLGGDCMKPGEIVPRRYLEVLARPGVKFTSQGSGRLALAERIASADNPLTARVMANRIWHHLFGTGIVRSVDDFGRIGELPSHPELLDYLAGAFVEQSWSIKHLIRRIVQTETFRMSNRLAPVGKEIDPHNRLLHHFPARRMGAEAIRDSILFTSGRLDRKMYGLSIAPYRDQPNIDRRLFPGPLDGHGRRSVYTKVCLMEGAKFLGAFNFPGSKVTQGRRDVTNVPSQALALLNAPFVIEQSGVWAKRLVDQPQDSVASKIERMFLQALGRPPSAGERREFEQLARRLAELYQVQPANILTERVIWQDFAHVMFNLKEFIYIP